MSHRNLTAICFSVFALVAGLTTAAPVGAAEYGAFVIHNSSNVAINYAVVWGDGDVETFTVEVGEQNAHYVAFDRNGEIPSPYIVFDCKGGDDDNTWLSYDLDAYSVNDPHSGKDYTFKYSADGRFLDLYEG